MKDLTKWTSEDEQRLNDLKPIVAMYNKLKQRKERIMQGRYSNISYKAEPDGKLKSNY